MAEKKSIGALAQISKARRALEAARTVPELKGIRDQAEAVRQYAKQADAGRVVQNECAEIKIRAERRIGDLLREMQDRGELATKGRPGKTSHDGRLTLGDIGLNWNQSSRWQSVASVPEEEFAMLIAEVNAREGGELTTAELLKKAREIGKQRERAAATEANDDVEGSELVPDFQARHGTYRTVYLDPPWAYNDSNCDGAAAAQYKTMTVAEIQALKPHLLLPGEGGHMWMWTTWPMLREGVVQRLFSAWGLTWKGEIVWDKDRMLLGRWIRVQTEVLVLGVCGICPRLSASVRGIHREKSGRHSEKPDSFYDLIEEFSPGPRIELFARRARGGWDRWGNEA